jgi:hypothetical protein
MTISSGGFAALLAVALHHSVEAFGVGRACRSEANSPRLKYRNSCAMTFDILLRVSVVKQ